VAKLRSHRTGVVVGALAVAGALTLAVATVAGLDDGGSSSALAERPSHGDNKSASGSSKSSEGGLVVQRAGSTRHRFDVSSTRVDVTSRWMTGAVVLSLTSPSGRVIDRDTVAPDVTHEVGPTFESYHVTSPEHGTWTATLYGDQVAPEGEETRLDIHQAPVPDAAPTARFEQTLTGRTVTVDGSASDDPAGSIVKYLWEFGDGGTAHGATATHVYTEPGTFLVTLAVQDKRGRWNVTSSPSTLDIR
jgi:hypothetical protein